MKTFPLEPMEGTPMLSEYTLEYTLRTHRWSFIFCTPEFFASCFLFLLQIPKLLSPSLLSMDNFYNKSVFQDALLYLPTSKYMC